MNSAELVGRFLERHPREAGRALAGLDPVPVAAVLEVVDPEIGADVLAAMPPPGSYSVLDAMGPSAGAAALDRMPVSDATVFAASCRAEQREPLLSAMAAERAAQVRSRLQFPPDAVGRIMEPMRHVVSERASPDQVRQTFSETGARYLYRVDTDGCLTGVVSRRGAPLKGSPLPMVESRALSIPARLSLDAVRGHPGWEEVDAMPVVDSGNRLIGVVRHKQVRRMARSEIHVVDEAVTGVDALISLGEAYCSGLWEIIGPLTVAERISPGGDGGDK